MKELKIESTLYVFDSLQDVPQDIKNLMNHAIKARNKAYAPYSKFNVGAAILLDNDEIISGSNQENAAYPSSLCAERTAIYYAGAKYPEAKMLKMAITAASQNNLTDNPIPPCGACRQAISEYEVNQNIPIEIYFMGEMGNVVKSNSISDLLPFVFDRSAL